MQAFWSGGLTGTSVDDLLHATGLSRSSMYQCLGNRDAMLELAVTRYVDQQIVAIERLFSGRTLEESLLMVFNDAALTNFDGRGCLVANGLNELHAGDDARIALIRAGFARLAMALRSAIARRAPLLADPEQRSVEVMVAVAGLRTLQRAGIAAPTLLATARRYATMLAA